MKCKQLILLFMLLLGFTACSQTEDNSSQQIDVNENKQEETIDENNQQAIISDKEGEQQEQELQKEEEKSEETKPQYIINEKSYIKPIGDAQEKIVLLTIDDAPDKYALEMAHTLKELKVNAIFFVNGHFLNTDEKKAMLKEIHEMGFPIGNHTMTHENLKEISEEEQYKEMVELNDLVEEIIGERPKFFRAPFGANTDYSRQLALDEKMVLMNWSYGYDYEKQYMAKEPLADIMVNSEYLTNGANLLMHDRKWTNEALMDIVTGLQNKGYTIADPQLIETLQ